MGLEESLNLKLGNTSTVYQLFELTGNIKLMGGERIDKRRGNNKVEVLPRDDQAVISSDRGKYLMRFVASR
jgi:hypothetical protein